MDRVREQELAHRNLERGGILLGVGVAGMIAAFAVAIGSGNDRLLFGALVGWLLAVLGAIWLVDGFRHRYAARRANVSPRSRFDRGCRDIVRGTR